MKSAPLVKCPSCKGEGTVPLASSLAKTLAKFVPGKRLTAKKLHQPKSKITINAMNNRLEKLRALGLIARERKGHEWEYFRALTSEPFRMETLSFKENGKAKTEAEKLNRADVERGRKIARVMNKPTRIGDILKGIKGKAGKKQRKANKKAMAR